MAITAYIVIRVLRETRPFWIYFASTVAFAVAQVFRLSPVGVSICEVRSLLLRKAQLSTECWLISYHIDLQQQSRRIIHCDIPRDGGDCGHVLWLGGYHER